MVRTPRLIWLMSLIACLLLVLPSAVLADQQKVDNGLTLNGLQNTLILSAAPGTTGSTDVQLVIQWSGNNHLAPGSRVTLALDPKETTLPKATATPVTLTIPSNWSAGKYVTGTSTVTFTAPALPGTYEYAAKWKSQTDFQNELTGSPALTIDLTVTAPPDTTPPVIAPPTVSGTAGNNGWYTGNVTVDWSVTDDQSAVTARGCDETTIKSDGVVTLTCSATSAGGTSSDSVTIQRDATPPAIAGAPDRAPNAAGWYNAPVTVSFSCTDNLSGVAGCAGPAMLGEGANQSVAGAAADVAGNTAAVQVPGINIDETAPRLSLPANIAATATSTAGAVINYSVSAADDLSGVASVSCDRPSGSAFAPGETIVTCTAQDNAGNTVTGTFSVKVTYSWSGILAPVPNTVFNLNRTVPVKFQLTGASAGITDLAAKLWVTRIPGGSEMVATSTAASNTGNLFRYDVASHQYLFDMATKPLTAGTYQLRVDLGDGTRNTVQITLK